jgi:hypothetical protein
MSRGLCPRHVYCFSCFAGSSFLRGALSEMIAGIGGYCFYCHSGSGMKLLLVLDGTWLISLQAEAAKLSALSFLSRASGNRISFNSCAYKNFFVIKMGWKTL